MRSLLCIFFCYTGRLGALPYNRYPSINVWGGGGEGPLRKKTRSLHGNDLEERDFP